MTKDEIIELARESQKESFVGDTGHWFKMEVKDLERFAALVAAHEREACAKVCDENGNTSANMNKSWRNGCFDSAAAIRARGSDALGK